MMQNRRTFVTGTSAGVWLGMGVALLLTVGRAVPSSAQAAPPVEERSPAAPGEAAEETSEYEGAGDRPVRGAVSGSLEERWAAPFAVTSDGRLATRERRRVVVLDDTAAARVAVASAVSEGLSAGEVVVEGDPDASDGPEPETEAAEDAGEAADNAGGTQDDAGDATADAGEATDEEQGPAGPRRHTVSRGDTLYGIARRYGVSAASIRSANTLSGDIVRLGETLIIPPEEVAR